MIAHGIWWSCDAASPCAFHDRSPGISLRLQKLYSFHSALAWTVSATRWLHAAIHWHFLWFHAAILQLALYALMNRFSTGNSVVQAEGCTLRFPTQALDWHCGYSFGVHIVARWLLSGTSLFGFVKSAQHFTNIPQLERCFLTPNQTHEVLSPQWSYFCDENDDFLLISNSSIAAMLIACSVELVQKCGDHPLTWP